MDEATFPAIVRDYYREGVDIMKLGIFMEKKNVTYHTKVKPRLHNRPEETQKIRVLTKQMFSGVGFNTGENSARTRSVNPGSMKLHTLDETCVVFPSLTDYVGAYRFVPSDDIPTITAERMAYLRCPNILTAVSLSLWLRHPRIVEAVRHEFRKKRGKNSKEMNFTFLSVIPVPEGMLQPHIVGRALEIDNKIVEAHKELNAMVDELKAMSVEYT